MAQLNVEVRGDMQHDRLMAVPFEVVSAEGLSLGRGVASPRHPDRTVKLPPDASRAYVLATLPNGKQIQAPVRFGPGGDAQAELEFDLSPHEWLQWVMPFESLGHLRDPHTGRMRATRAIGPVWMALWRLAQGQWEPVPMPLLAANTDSGVRQFTLNLAPQPHLLQIGGEHVASRLVSLPPGGDTMLAITQSANEQADTVRVTIGREQAMNDIVMAYLTRGQQQAVDTLVDAWQQADEMLMEKFVDPVAACAGAYALLKLGRIAQRRGWVENLVHWFPYADGAIVAACMEMNDRHSDPGKVRHYIDISLERGLPIFAIGMSLLVEAMAAVHRGHDESAAYRAAYRAAQKYLECRAVVGPYFAFYGVDPGRPMYDRVYGSSQDLQPVPVLAAAPAAAAPPTLRGHGTFDVALPGASLPAGDWYAPAAGLPRVATSPGVPLPSVEVFSAFD